MLVTVLLTRAQRGSRSSAASCVSVRGSAAVVSQGTVLRIFTGKLALFVELETTVIHC